jgi:hypothetical protein
MNSCRHASHIHDDSDAVQSLIPGSIDYMG